jgi:hypothetical protein
MDRFIARENINHFRDLREVRPISLRPTPSAGAVVRPWRPPCGRPGALAHGERRGVPRNSRLDCRKARTGRTHLIAPGRAVTARVFSRETDLDQGYVGDWRARCPNVATHRNRAFRS